MTSKPFRRGRSAPPAKTAKALFAGIGSVLVSITGSECFRHLYFSKLRCVICGVSMLHCKMPTPSAGLGLGPEGLGLWESCSEG